MNRFRVQFDVAEMLRSVFPLAIVMLLFGRMVAQPKAELFALQQKYPDNPVIYTNVNELIDINVVEGKFDIKMNVNKESMLLDEHANRYSEGSITYSSLVYLSNLEASTLYPNEKRYKEIKVEKYKESDRFSDIAFYDDLKERKYTYPSLTKGAKRRFNATYQLKDPYLLTSFIIQDYIPVQNAFLKIVCPADMEIGYKIFNGDSVNVIYEVHKEKNKIIHEWKCSDIKKFESEGSNPGWLYYVPHIVYYIKSYTVNDKREKVIGSVDDLHVYYSKLIKGINDKTSESLKRLTDSLTANVSTDEQKVKAIYYWVKDNIKYIAFESGYEGFIPDSASAIFEKRYGDCKGMSSIITKMLDCANIPSYLTWIGTRSLPYHYAENPTSGADNHMIAAVKLNGDYVFLDGTSTTTPLGYPSLFTQGKEAIVHLADDKYDLVTVPEVSDSLNVNCDSVFVEITKELKLIGSGITRYTGFERDEVLEVLKDHSGEEKLTILKNYYQKGNNKFILDNYNELGASNRDTPYIIRYNFNVSDYVLQSGNEIFVNLNLEKPYSKKTVEKKRRLDLIFDYKQRVHNTVTIKIPEGYRVEYLPVNDSLEHELFAYSFRYSQTKNTVTLDTELRLKCLLLKKEYFEVWNDFIARLKKNYSESVTFRIQ